MSFEFKFQILKIIFHGLFSALLSFCLVPFYLKLAQKFKLGDYFVSPERLAQAPIASQTLQEKAGIPTMAGIIIWWPPIFLALFFWLMQNLTSSDYFKFMNFLTPRETYLPLFGLFIGGIIGLIDDILHRLPKKVKLGAKEKFLVYLSLALFFAWWFIVKLNYKFIDLVDLRFNVHLLIFFFIFIFIFLSVSLSFNEIDGLDGLFAGVAISMLIFFLLVALIEQKFNLATYISTLLGSLFVYLWFNFYPALFFDGNNGSFSVGSSLALISFLTGTYLLLPFVGLALVIESGSVILQKLSKKLFKRKIFLSTPIHHHFKALGLKEPKIVVRFWLVNFLGVLVGLIFYLFLKSFS